MAFVVSDINLFISIIFNVGLKSMLKLHWYDKSTRFRQIHSKLFKNSTKIEPMEFE